MKVMLADDHPLFMEGLQYVLKTHGIEVIGTARDGREAIEQNRLLHPDIILMDIKMPGYSGLDALRLIKAEFPEVKVVMLTISEDDEDLFLAVKYGASGYLLKNANAEELVNMLSDIENGEAPILPGFANRLYREFKHNGKMPGDSIPGTEGVTLTQRQLEILERAARGITYKEVGEALGLTERTVKYHMGRIIEQLHLENRAQVIAYAVRMGIVKVWEDR